MEHYERRRTENPFKNMSCEFQSVISSLIGQSEQLDIGGNKRDSSDQFPVVTQQTRSRSMCRLEKQVNDDKKRRNSFQESDIGSKKNEMNLLDLCALRLFNECSHAVVNTTDKRTLTATNRSRKDTYIQKKSNEPVCGPRTDKMQVVKRNVNKFDLDDTQTALQKRTQITASRNYSLSSTEHENVTTSIMNGTLSQDKKSILKSKISPSKQQLPENRRVSFEYDISPSRSISPADRKSTKNYDESPDNRKSPIIYDVSPSRSISPDIQKSPMIYDVSSSRSISPDSKSSPIIYDISPARSISPDNRKSPIIYDVSPSRSISPDNRLSLLRNDISLARSISPDYRKLPILFDISPTTPISPDNLNSPIIYDVSPSRSISPDNRESLSKKSTSYLAALDHDLTQKSGIITSLSSVTNHLPTIIVTSVESQQLEPINRSVSYKSQSGTSGARSESPNKNELGQRQMNGKFSSPKLPPLRTERKQTQQTKLKHSFVNADTNIRKKHVNKEEQSNNDKSFDGSILNNNLLEPITANKLSTENIKDAAVRFKSYSSLGKRHSIDVGRILLNKDKYLAKLPSKQHMSDKNVSNICDNLASATCELKKSIEVLTNKTHLSAPTEQDQYRRKSFSTATGEVNGICAQKPDSLGGRHSEERFRAKTNHSKRLSSYLSRCEEDLPTSTLLEIKRLRGEIL